MKLEVIEAARKAGDHWLLNRITMSIHTGQRLALVGPTGSGKTLLLRTLAMLDPVDAGEVRWGDATVRGSDVPKFRSQVIYLHQRPALIEGTVEQNLQQPFLLRVHQNKTFDRARIINLLKLLGRTELFLSKQQRDLSGGEQQLTALLRAVQLDPDMLLLDEPTAALDANTTDQVEALVSTWLDEQAEARAIIWVTHDLEQARRVSARIMTIHEGRLAGDTNG